MAQINPEGGSLSAGVPDPASLEECCEAISEILQRYATASAPDAVIPNIEDWVLVASVGDASEPNMGALAVLRPTIGVRPYREIGLLRTALACAESAVSYFDTFDDG